jgi:hypothetical protein
MLNDQAPWLDPKNFFIGVGNSEQHPHQHASPSPSSTPQRLSEAGGADGEEGRGRSKKPGGQRKEEGGQQESGGKECHALGEGGVQEEESDEALAVKVSRSLSPGSKLLGPQFTCFTSTHTQILTQKPPL